MIGLQSARPRRNDETERMIADQLVLDLDPVLAEMRRLVHGTVPFSMSRDHATRFAWPQLLSEAHRPRSSRKRSTGTELASARTRLRPASVHWKPHFSNTRREAGLVTRAAACNASQSRSVKA